MASSSFPPTSVTASSVLVVSGRTKINAPAAVVFDLLTDPSTWPEWNTFVTKAVSLPSQGPASKMKEGDKVRFFVSMPMKANKPQATTSDELVQLISPPSDTDPKHYRASWGWTPPFLMP